MAYFRGRKHKRKGGLPSPAASQAADLGLLLQESSPQPWVEDAVPRQPAVGDPEEDIAGFCLLPRLRKGWQLSKALRFLWHESWLKDGSKKRGAEESQRASGVQAQAAQRCTKVEGRAPGLPEELGTSQKAPQGGEVHSAVPLPGDEPVGGWKARDGDVPKEGGGHGGEMGQTQHLVQAGTSRDMEGRIAGSSQSLGFKVEGKEAATIPQGDGQDFSPLSAKGSSGDERRGKVWEKLHHHGEDMARWEGRSTRELAVRLIEVILQTETKMYPVEMGSKSTGQEQAAGWTRASVGSSAEVRALVGTNEDVSTARQRPQDLAVYPDVPVSGSTDGDKQPEPFGDEQIWEGSDDDLPEQGGPPAVPSPSVQIHCVVVVGAKSEEEWREEFAAVWSRHEMDCGLVSGEQEVSGGPAPFQKQPRLPADEEEAVASILQTLLEEGVVVEGSSAFNSPLKLTRKDNGRMRLTLSCKAVNKATPRVVAPVAQDTTKLVSTLSPKSRYFSVVDLSNASFAIPLSEGSRARFAFTFRGQQYLFTRLPQGFHSTTAIVNQRVSQMLSQLGQGDQPWVVSHIDDILIAGRSYEETRDRTRTVLELIQKTGFKAKFEKAQLVQREVLYFGMTIGDKGREIHASKREGILKTPCPQDAGKLRSLLGQFGFLRDHIPGFWEMALPLHRLTQKQVRWEWGPEQEEALNRLKGAVQAAPPLRFPDKSQPFLIRLTTGKEAVGASLLQEDECGQLVPVGHSSRILKDHEASCPPQEKGCLAAVWAVQAFETLTGPAPILIRMPHSPWKYLLWGEALRSRGTNPHPAQWTLLLVNNGAMAKGPPTNILVPIAPSLPELSPDIPKASVWFTASKRSCSIGFAAVSLEERWLLGASKGGSVPGAELVALKQLLQHHGHSSPLYVYMSCWSLVERLGNQTGEQEWGSSGKGLWASILRWVHSNPGMLHVRCVGDDWSEEPEEKEWNLKAARRAWAMSGRAGGCWQVWEPSKHEKQEIIAQCHSCLHDGVEETLARVRQVASWEEDRKQVSRWVQNCLRCADGAGRVLAQRTEGPWSQLLLGCISGLTKTEAGHRFLLVVEDEFSGWVEAFPMKERTAEEAAEVLFREVFARYGTPLVIRLPHAPRFLWDAVVAATALNLPWDAQQASQKGPAVAALKRLAWGAGKGWVKMLPLILAGFRSVRAQEAVLSPYQIGFPLEMRRGGEGKANPQGNDFAWLSSCRRMGPTTGTRPKPCC
ncbi:uncharacterized protein LOC136015692 [Lathamus discolor]|uniref:uncharacterized protein LOC136015692 n=1 Tax=Lathamus discolor TaxID=678569 RepID=UPI0032B6FE49